MPHSIVWNFFQKLPDDASRAKCSIGDCLAVYVVNGTRNMLRHLKTKHPSEISDFEEEEALKKREEILMKNDRKVLNSNFRRLQARYILTSNAPFSTVENAQFQQMIKCANTHIDMITADTVKTDIEKISNRYIEANKEIFSKRKNLTLVTDGWSVRNCTYEIYVIIASYCETNGEMVQKVISVVEIESTKAVDLLDQFNAALSKTGMSLANFKNLVTDSASNLRLFGEKAGLEQVLCACHQLHLILTESTGMFDKLFTKASAVATALAKSTKKKSAFLKNAKLAKVECGLPRNFSKTRWNGKEELMRCVAGHFQTICDTEGLGEFSFDNLERSTIVGFLDLVSPLKTLTLTFEKRRTNASEIIPRLMLAEKSIIENGKKYEQLDLTINTNKKLQPILLKFKHLLLKNMKKRLLDYIQNLLISTCIFLDARYSFTKAIETNGLKWRNIEYNVTQKFLNDLELKQWYEDQFSSSGPVTKKTRKNEDDAMSQFLNNCQRSDLEFEEALENEVTKYKSIVNGCRPSASSLYMDFWRINGSNLPILHRCATIYGAVPASSAESERIFSKASRFTANSLRNKLNGETTSTSLLAIASIGFESSSNGDDYDIGELEKEEAETISSNDKPSTSTPTSAEISTESNNNTTFSRSGDRENGYTSE